MCKQSGIYNNIEPVLSLPLGTNTVSVGEIAKLYQTFIDGKTYTFYENGPLNQLTLIKRIEDRNGNIIYKPKEKIKSVVSEDVTQQMQEMLRRTVSHGTGRRARGELFLEFKPENNEKTKPIKIRIPALGKTGTTNQFTTSYFAGIIPYLKKLNREAFPLKKQLYYSRIYRL